MKIIPLDITKDIERVEEISKLAFSITPDSSLEEWFSFDYMQKMITEHRGLCLKSLNENNEMTGMIYAQQENPINGKEGVEKWVIIIAGVDPKHAGQGIGSALLNKLENQLKSQGIKKLFTFTNKNDEKVVNYYKKNGYKDAGWIKDYQYGKDNSAVFLLKYLV